MPSREQEPVQQKSELGQGELQMQPTIVDTHSAESREPALQFVRQERREHLLDIPSEKETNALGGESSMAVMPLSRTKYLDQNAQKIKLHQEAARAISIGKQADTYHPDKRAFYDVYGQLTGFIYDAVAEKLYHPGLVLNGVLSGLTNENTAARTSSRLVTQDLLRSVFEQYFPQFQGKLAAPLKIAGALVKGMAPAAQFLPSLDAIGDGIITAADLVEGRSLSRLVVDGALIGYDAIPLPLPGDIALLASGLDKSERVIQYGLMEALLSGMQDEASPLYSQREDIARTILGARSLAASTLHGTLNGNESLLGKGGMIETDNNGDIYIRVWKLPRVKLTRVKKASIPYAEQIPDPQHALSLLDDKKKKHGIEKLSRQEQMQWKMLLLITQAQQILNRHPQIIEDNFSGNLS